jgi:hypothetical protein
MSVLQTIGIRVSLNGIGAEDSLFELGQALQDLVALPALANERDPQRRRGLEALLALSADDLRPECLRERRAVEVLEKLEHADAHAWLAELAAGPAHARLTREAGAAMARLRMRAAAKAD